jgi:hypothetical protein
MPARTKRRAKFDFRSRPFVWWVDGDRYLRICSSDKRFIISYPIATDGVPPLIEVIGQEFLGVDPSEQRPVRLIVPQPSGKSMGVWVDGLLQWSFDPTHEVTRYDGPLRFM